MSHIPLISASQCTLLIILDTVVKTKLLELQGSFTSLVSWGNWSSGGLIYSFDMCVCRINIDIPQALTLSHRLRLIRCTKPWNLSSLLFLLLFIPPSLPPSTVSFTVSSVSFCCFCPLMLLSPLHFSFFFPFFFVLLSCIRLSCGVWCWSNCSLWASIVCCVCLGESLMAHVKCWSYIKNILYSIFF